MHQRRSFLGPLAAVVVLLLAACAPRGPEPIAYGRENCDRCHMSISDQRFGAELMTEKGKVKKFDSIECLASYVLETHGSEPTRGIWVTDHEHPGTLIQAEGARFLRSEGAHSPMALGVLAFASDADAEAAQQRVGGTVLGWGDVLQLVAREGDRHGAGAHADAQMDVPAEPGGAP